MSALINDQSKFEMIQFPEIKFSCLSVNSEETRHAIIGLPVWEVWVFS